MLKQRLYCKNDVNPEEVNEFLDDSYNRVLQFAKGFPRNSNAREKAVQVEASVRALDRIFFNARREAAAELGRLRNSVQSFTNATIDSSEQWYTHGDLTGMLSTPALRRPWD